MLFKKLAVGIIMFTMFFGGGLIPGFLNIKSLGLYNTMLALIIPGCLSVYNAIICKTAIHDHGGFQNHISPQIPLQHSGSSAVTGAKAGWERSRATSFTVQRIAAAASTAAR